MQRTTAVLAVNHSASAFERGSIALGGRFMRPCIGDSVCGRREGAAARLHPRKSGVRPNEGKEGSSFRSAGRVRAARRRLRERSPRPGRAGPDPARRQGGRQPRRLHRRHRLQGEPQRRVDEQSRGRPRQDLRRRQRPDPGPRRPALADHAEPSPALPLLRRLHDAQARHRRGPRLGRQRLHRRRRGQGRRPASRSPSSRTSTPSSASRRFELNGSFGVH